MPRQNRFVCMAVDCNKIFKRKEHLERHQLNHNGTRTVCDRCRAVFYRDDLLERHLKRHAEKDLEAGGEGLGVLSTKKRTWLDLDGKIITRPSRRSRSSNTRASSANEETADCMISPQSTGRMSDNAVNQNEQQQQQADPNQSSRGLSNERSEDPSQLIPEFLRFQRDGPKEDPGQQFPDASGGQNSYIGALEDDIFVPDTASSFTMPFTTMQYYSWIFDDANTHSLSSAEISNLNGGTQSSMSFPSPDTSAGSHHHSSVSALELENAHQSGQNLTDQNQIKNNGSQDGALYTTPNSLVNNEVTRTEQAKAWNLSSREQSKNSMSFRPTIDEVTRLEITEFVLMATSRDDEFISQDSEFLSLHSLQNFLDLFFSEFAELYPLIHKPSFKVSQVNVMLLTSILLLGATYSSKQNHQIAVRIHDFMRGVLVSSSYFHATPKLWVLQSVLLIEIFGKCRAGMKQHDMAHLFHGLLINLIRRSGSETSVPQMRSVDQIQDLDEEWETWVEAESKKRLAFTAFLFDVQHASLFSQTLCMSAFELRMPLPCDGCLWEADSAQQWLEARQYSGPAVPFLSVLKRYLNCNKDIPPLNKLSRLLIIHGLMAIAWDMKRRDQTSLGMNNDSYPWKSRLAKAYDFWKDNFDDFTNKSMAKTSSSRSRRSLIKFITSANAIYHSAHIILWAEILDLQITAGAQHILGRPVTRSDYSRSKAQTFAWAKQVGHSERSLWHAAHILREGIANLDDFEADGSFHYPWCLYLATLTCWAFFYVLNQASLSQPPIELNNVEPSGRVGMIGQASQIKESPFDDGFNSGYEQPISWDPRSEVTDLLSLITNATPDYCRTVSSKCHTNGLLFMISNYLEKIRWAVVYEGLKVLRDLCDQSIPKR